MQRRRIALLLLASASTLASVAPAQVVPIWPQFGGPSRNFQAATADLAVSWPASGPPVVWSRTLGEGFSGIAATSAALYTMYRRGGDEVVIALDRATGGTRWEHAVSAPALDEQDLSQGPGPHATPLLTGDLVCAAGVTAQLRCLDAATGRLRWSHDLTREFGATVVFRGYSSSPMASGDLVIVQAGGPDHAVIAFDRASGAVRWHGGTHANGNASPVIATEASGGPQVVGFFADEVAGFDLRTGRELWTHPHPQRFRDSIALPLIVDGRDVVVSSALDGGTRRVAIAPQAGEARERWHQSRLGVYYTNLVMVDGMILGSSGGVGPTFFTALDAATGAVLWQTRDVKRANTIVAGGRLLMRDEEGALVLARATREGINELARARVLAEGAPSPPTLVGTTLYARDRQQLIALDLGRQH